MKCPTVLLALAIAMAGLSCGGTPPAAATASADGTPTLQTPGETLAPSGSATAGAAPQGGVTVSNTDADVPPQGTRFHLFCDAITGPNHVIRASQLKAQLIQLTGMRGWHIIHADDQSSLYFGYYRTISKDDPRPDPQEVARAHADLRRINDLKNVQGERLFRSTMFLPISEADPTAPAQWNLANAPADAYWSLQIGAYRGEPTPGEPDRKQCAVDAVRALRAAGIEAYYYHGETISSVCIGAWPRDAIKAQESAVASSVRADATLLVLPDVVPDNINTRMTDREGHELLLQAPKLEILDQNMARMVHEHPYHAINGQVFERGKTKDGTPIPDASFLVLIPHADSGPPPLARDTGVRHTSSSADSVDQAAANAITGDSPPSTPATPTVPTPGRGRLPSLDQP